MGNKVFVPNHINILGRKWKIKMVNKTFAVGPKPTCHGVACPVTKSIKLNKNHKNSVNTLAHELAHAFLFETGVIKNNEFNTNILALFIEDVMVGITIIDEKKLKIVKKKKRGNAHGSKKNN